MWREMCSFLPNAYRYDSKIAIQNQTPREWVTGGSASHSCSFLIIEQLRVETGGWLRRVRIPGGLRIEDEIIQGQTMYKSREGVSKTSRFVQTSFGHPCRLKAGRMDILRSRKERRRRGGRRSRRRIWHTYSNVTTAKCASWSSIGFTSVR